MQYTDLMQSPSKSQCNFKKKEQKNDQICMEPQKTPNSQSNPEGEKTKKQS